MKLWFQTPMKSDNPHLNFTFLDAEFFETLDHYKSTPELIEFVRSICAEGWKITPRGYWCHCNPGAALGVQGWKIHIAGMPATAVVLLSKIVPICAGEGVPFKFLSDLRMVRLSISKNWGRMSGGKFITIYPPDDSAFERMIQKCHEATRGLIGPYIITDSRYRDSGVVFYRYGEHMGVGGIDASGRSVRAIRGPDGSIVEDKRDPLAAVPSWLSDPLNHGKVRPNTPTEMWLHGRRYRITGARRYSNWGGIYQGEDTISGRAVIVREARPHLGDPADAREPQRLLRKQARIMEKLQGTELAPNLIDLFEEQGHVFLVEEMLGGDTLWGYAMNFGHFLAKVDSRSLDTFIYHTARALIQGLIEVHERKIVLRDLTKSNVRFVEDHHVKFFDFEFSFELDGDDPPLQGGTEGYMSPEQRLGARPTVAEDYYALGALLLDLIAFTATGLSINRKGVLAALHQTIGDLGLPNCYIDAVTGLTAPVPEDRIDPMAALRIIEDHRARSWMLPPANEIPAFPPFNSGGPDDDVSLPKRKPPGEDLKQRLKETVDGITSYICGTLKPFKSDILWPPSAETFAVNPVCLAFGASGIVSYLDRVGTAIPTGVPQWIIERATPDSCPPGLYNGLSGVALCLRQLGLEEEAESVLEASNDRQRITEIPGLYHGAAGWGLANLIFWQMTGSQKYLERAQEIGWHLLNTAKRSSQGMFWETRGETAFGLGFGASGIALFMIFLNAASPEHRFLEAAAAALDYDMGNARWSFGRIFWPEVRSTSSNVPLVPGTRFGTAGVGTAAIRMYAATGEPHFRQMAEQCAFTASSRLSNKLWQDYGLSGSGEFMLDMFHFLSDDIYLNTAYYLAEAILSHAMRKPQGIAFTGIELLRISCDFAFGSAGIGWFLHRLLHPEASRLFFPDSMLDRNCSVASFEYESA